MTASDARRAEARESAFFTRHLKDADPEVYSAVAHEAERQQNEIELIASENIVSQAVLDAAGTLLTNKYAEGYPGRRYYGGCQYVDVVEQLAIDVPSACSTAPSPMCSRIRAARRTSPSCWRC